MHDHKIALIDIGSNTIRLVIYGINAYCDMDELLNLKTPARLSQYLDQTKSGEVTLSPQGIKVLVDTLTAFHRTCQAHQVNEEIILATAAIRQSQNQDEIRQAVKTATGSTLRILSEKEEASYGQYAVNHSLSLEDMVTIDIGGGSCELTLSHNNSLIHYHSFPFGVVTLKERFFKDVPHNDPQAIENTRKFIKEQFKSLDWLKKCQVPLVGIGGSARNIAQVYQRLTDYPIAGIHGYHLSHKMLEKTLDLFQSKSLKELDDLDGLSSDRRDIIIPANLAFLELFALTKAPTFLISKQGLREGVIMHYLNQRYNRPFDPDLVKSRSVSRACREFKVNTVNASTRSKLAMDLYRQLCELGLFNYQYNQQLEIELAAYLFQCGQFIDQEAESQHTFYLLSNMNLAGFNHKERVRLAILASFRNKSLLKQYIQAFTGWFDDMELAQLIKLGGLLKFSQALDDSQTHPIQTLKLTKSKSSYQLRLYCNGPVVAEQYRAQKHLKHLKRALDGANLCLDFVPLESLS